MESRGGDCAPGGTPPGPVAIEAEGRPTAPGGLMPIDHTSVNVRDYERSKAFYTRALAPIGYGLLIEVPAAVNPGGVDAVGFGADGKPDFWIGTGDPGSPPAHVAFTVTSREEVNAFH